MSCVCLPAGGLVGVGVGVGVGRSRSRSRTAWRVDAGGRVASARCCYCYWWRWRCVMRGVPATPHILSPGPDDSDSSYVLCLLLAQPMPMLVGLRLLILLLLSSTSNIPDALCSQVRVPLLKCKKVFQHKPEPRRRRRLAKVVKDAMSEYSCYATTMMKYSSSFPASHNSLRCGDGDMRKLATEANEAFVIHHKEDSSKLSRDEVANAIKQATSD
jgi:hypothetical protein